jgi:aldehyde:ferredoxin oxidoreductase
MYGWTGRILDVDLASGRVSVKRLDEALSRLLLGGRGVNARLLWDALTEPGVDPIGPDNVLVVGAGALSGTIVPCSGRTTVTCKGPLTGRYLKASMGGGFAAMLKYAGYDHIAIRGKAPSPQHLYIQDEEVTLADAGRYWGLDIFETDQALRKDTDSRIETICIGPAGENLIRFSVVSGSVNSPAARGGVGAVMGSKNLKAIAVVGSGSVDVAHPQALFDLAMQWRQRIEHSDEAETLYTFGTSGHLIDANEGHVAAVRNWEKTHADPEKVKQVSGQALVQGGYLKRRVSCTSCDISCHRFTAIDDGRYAGTCTGGPEFESFGALGLGVEVYDTETVIKAQELCNRLGLDVISTGATIQWAMECFERGVLSQDDLDGTELRFGDGEGMLSAIERIARREGKMGQLLALGSSRAARKVGQNSQQWAMCNAKGMEQSSGDLRATKAYALAFAVNPRGCDHLHAQPWAEFGLTKEARRVIEEVTGKTTTKYTPLDVAKIVRWHEDTYAVLDSLGICIQPVITAYVIGPADIAEMFSLATGVSCDEESILRAGRRILTLEKCFNTQEGADRSHDDLPWKTMNIPAPSGPAKRTMHSGEKLGTMLDEYYLLHGWDRSTSWPTRQTLEDLGLREVAERLASHIELS